METTLSEQQMIWCADRTSKTLDEGIGKRRNLIFLESNHTCVTGIISARWLQTKGKDIGSNRDLLVAIGAWYVD
jgi:hypothetical protein